MVYIDKFTNNSSQFIIFAAKISCFLHFNVVSIENGGEKKRFVWKLVYDKRREKNK